MTVDAQLDSPHVPVLYLAELAFASGTVRLTNWGHAIDWLGHTWMALNAVVSVTPVRSSERLEYPALDVGLQVSNLSLLALALGSPSDYRGRDFTLYQAVLDDDLKQMDDPEVAWGGVMDTVRVATGNGEDDSGSLVLRCEQQGRDKRAAMSLRLNNAQHQRRWPGDTFLSRVETLAGRPVPWLSKKFQQV